MSSVLRSCSPCRVAFAALLLAGPVCTTAQSAPLPQQITQHQQALAAARKASDRPRQAAELEALGNLYFQSYRFQTALASFNQALLLWRQMEVPKSESTTELEIGKINYRLDRFPQALSHLNRAVALDRRTGDRSGEAKALIELGLVDIELDENRKALLCFNQALPIVRDLHDPAGEAAALRGIGTVHDFLGQKQTALRDFNQSLQIEQAIHDRSGEAETLNHLGSVYNDLDEQQRALTLYRQALQIERELHDLVNETDTLHNLGQTYYDLDEQQKALDYFQQALQVEHTVQDRSGQAATLHNIATIYSDRGESEKALGLLQQALSIERELEDRSGEATTLSNIADVYSDLGDTQRALDLYNQVLPIQREIEDRSGEGTTLSNLGDLYSVYGDEKKALDFYDQALSALREVGDRSGEADVLNSIGGIYSTLGQEQKALNVYTQALPIYREVGDRSGEAGALISIGGIYSKLGQKQRALDLYNQALPIYRATGNRSGEADALSSLGVAYSELGDSQQALDRHTQALRIRTEDGERGGQAISLNALGQVYAGLSQFGKAIDFFNQALAIEREVGDRSGEANILDGLGLAYFQLGQIQKSLDLYNQALPIQREIGERAGEASTLNNIALAYHNLNQDQKGLDFYNQALAISRNVGFNNQETIILNNIGRSYDQMGQTQKALSFFMQALPLEREGGFRLGEAYTLWDIGVEEQRLGDTPGALRNFLAALSSAEDLDNPTLEGAIEDSLMGHFRDQKQLETAILFGTAAVNSYQQIRKNITGLDKELQAGYAQSKSATYRQLAELLVQAGRLGEAEQVLDLLKEQELKEIVRGGAQDAAAKVQPLKMSAPEQTAWGKLDLPEKMATALTPMTVEQTALLAKASPTPDDTATLQALNGGISQQTAQIAAYFHDTVAPELQQSEAAGTAVDEEGTQSYLQNTLASLGPDVVGIRILFGDQHVYAIVVTAHTRQRVELNATPAELRNKVLQVRDDLRTPEVDPKPHLQELYAMVVTPIDPVLNQMEATAPPSGHLPTLLWSLDGVLRYLPMAALYDGHKYMLERFENVLFTPNSYGHMAAAALSTGADHNILAMGLSQSYAGQPALPAVMQELDAVVRDPGVPASHGPMEGRLLPNDQFTLAALESELGAGKAFPVVHIASHYGVDASTAGEPYLLLGGEAAGASAGYKLTLSRIQDSRISFNGTQLLTLSACSTAADYRSRNGVEMDSLGMVAQQKDAAAVLATLWSVNDASTSLLMSDFYRRWATTPGIEKIEALRQAQLAMLHGNLQPPGEAYDLSHPYYWAPFVLFGNYR